ncbi:hypothetical protein A0K93_03795 [Corynebacterium sp. BCW_4722]|nr:hypothetical protein A0K93_03795 [Corynebacterium sp. BCW_4722]
MRQAKSLVAAACASVVLLGAAPAVGIEQSGQLIDGSASHASNHPDPHTGEPAATVGSSELTWWQILLIVLAVVVVAPPLLIHVFYAML